jgi:hypothetical protein
MIGQPRAEMKERVMFAVYAAFSVNSRACLVFQVYAIEWEAEIICTKVAEFCRNFARSLLLNVIWLEIYQASHILAMVQVSSSTKFTSADARFRKCNDGGDAGVQIVALC